MIIDKQKEQIKNIKLNDYILTDVNINDADIQQLSATVYQDHESRISSLEQNLPLNYWTELPVKTLRGDETQIGHVLTVTTSKKLKNFVVIGTTTGMFFSSDTGRTFTSIDGNFGEVHSVYEDSVTNGQLFDFESEINYHTRLIFKCSQYNSETQHNDIGIVIFYLDENDEIVGTYNPFFINYIHFVYCNAESFQMLCSAYGYDPNTGEYKYNGGTTLTDGTSTAVYAIWRFLPGEWPENGENIFGKRIYDFNIINDVEFHDTYPIYILMVTDFALMIIQYDYTGGRLDVRTGAIDETIGGCTSMIRHGDWIYLSNANRQKIQRFNIRTRAVEDVYCYTSADVISSISHDGDRIIAVSRNGHVVYSLNGIDWIERQISNDVSLTGVDCIGCGKYVTVGTSQAAGKSGIYLSEDLERWELFDGKVDNGTCITYSYPWIFTGTDNSVYVKQYRNFMPSAYVRRIKMSGLYKDGNAFSFYVLAPNE